MKKQIFSLPESFIPIYTNPNPKAKPYPIMCPINSNVMIDWEWDPNELHYKGIIISPRWVLKFNPACRHANLRDAPEVEELKPEEALPF